MELQSGGAVASEAVTEEELQQAFSEEMDGARGEFLILADEGGGFIQAAGEGDGPYVLEYRDPEQEKNCCARQEVGRDEARAAFIDYLRGGTQWREAHEWEELGASRAGCLTLVAATAGLALLLWML